MAPKKRQPKAKGEYRKVHPRLTVENFAYLNSLDADKSFSQILNRVIKEHRVFCNKPYTHCVLGVEHY